MTEAATVQRQFFDMLVESQYWPADRLVDHQRAQLEQLLRHARAHTLFYAHRLDVLFRRDGSIDWDRWRDVPILKRTELVAHHGAFLADALPAGHGPTGEASTSGSTGFPLKVIYTRLTALMTWAARWRADTWHDLDWSKTLYVRHGYDEAAAWPHGLALGPWGPPWEAAAQRGRAFKLNRYAKPDQQLEFIRRIGASYAAAAAPKQAHAIALEAERHRIELKLGAILTSGEDVTPLDREVCRRVLGSDIVDIYSSKEGNHMAYRCPSQTCWHVNAESLLLEILDEDGNPCESGKTGRVVITPFFSTAQPLIRYDHGDLAVAGERCVCGRTLPTITHLLGRVVHLFRHPDGRALSAFLSEESRVHLKAGPWQIAQVGPNDYEVRYVPLDRAVMGDEAAAEAAFRRRYFDDATVRFRRVDSIEPLASGKFMEYVNEFSPSPP
ncbi:MAG: hypothetical protein P4M09_15665 [Devosia sp.]|nr:hypothetical protein [Devosia sp.]